MEDVAEYHIQLGMPNFFYEPVKNQPTWAGLIRILLHIQNKPCGSANIRTYQAKSLGRYESETCLLELLPLPTPGIGKWLYAQHSKIHYLVDREKYTQIITPLHLKHLRGKIIGYAPSIVIFYGLGYRKWWEAITDVSFKGFLLGKHADMIFGIIKHPAAFGMTIEYYKKVGQYVSQ